MIYKTYICIYDMEVKSINQYAKQFGKSHDCIRSSVKIYTTVLPLYVKYEGNFYPVEKELGCVIYGENAPLTNSMTRPIKELKPKNNKQLAEYRKSYLSKNPEIKIKCKVRSMIYNSFRRGKNGRYRKNTKTEQILGCTMDDFIIHLQSLFEDGMTIHNHGKWHIDHIKPLSLAKNVSEIMQLCHYTNLQPLWAIDNMKKGSKYEQ